MNNSNSRDDLDWIYSSKKLRKLRSLRNPLEEKTDASDVKEQTSPDTIIDKKDPIFDEVIASSVHSKLNKAVKRKTSFGLKSNKLQITKRLQDNPSNTIKKMAEGNASAEELRSALHSYDPLCECEQCSLDL